MKDDELTYWKIQFMTWFITEQDVQSTESNVKNVIIMIDLSRAVFKLSVVYVEVITAMTHAPLTGPIIISIATFDVET